MNNLENINNEELLILLTNTWLQAQTTTNFERQIKLEELYFKTKKEVLRRLNKENNNEL